ncbi:hypothetical protein RMCBS344292_10030 [Rhizopus microsporus]|nr:hypothetical protein RMCBS344292_10030 [Rhizopus microsporus]
MDQETVYQLFFASYQPSLEARKQAEFNIKNFENLEGFLPTVLYIQATEQLDLGARQAAAIYFKNRVCNDWENETISEQDKLTIRNNIIQAMVTSPSIVGIHLTASLQKVLSVDFPNRWPNFMQDVERCFASKDMQTLRTGFNALHALIKVLEWKSGEHREPLYDIVQLTFPVIQETCLGLLESETAETLKLGLKIFYSSIFVELPPYFRDHTAPLVPWFSLFVKIIEKPIATSNSIDDLEDDIWWKIKKWAYKCINLLTEKYTLISQEVSHSFMTNFAPTILTAYLHQLDNWMKKTCYMSNKCLALSADFLDECVKYKATWQILKNHTDVLVAQFIFPLICFSSKDEQLWRGNAVEYVYKRIDIWEESNIPQQNVISLLVHLAKNRKKQAFMNMLKFVNDILSTTSTEQEKDGALCIMSALAPIVLESKKIVPMMEPFFVNYVFPIFKSECPFLRARACDITRHFEDLEFSEEQNLHYLYDNVLNCLSDSELPVQVQAALALQGMIRYSSVKDAMIPHLPFILKGLLDLTSQVDLDGLVSVLEEFVEAFSEHLAPFSIELCQRLSDIYLHLLEDVVMYQQADDNSKDTLNKEESLNSKIIAAMSVLDTIQLLVLQLKDYVDTLYQIETLLLPVIQCTIESRAFAFYNEIYELIGFCVLSSKRVSPTIWLAFELCYKDFKGDKEGLQYYATQMVPSLYNFITFSKDEFIGNEQIKYAMLDIVDTCMNSEDLNEGEKVPTCRLIESMLLNCREEMDQYISSFLNLAFRYLPNDIQSTRFRICCLEIIVNCIYYNPQLTLGLLENNGWSQNFFSLWFSNFTNFTRTHDLKLNIAALCSLLKLQSNEVPMSLQAIWPQTLARLSCLFKDLMEKQNEISECEEEEVEGNISEEETEGEEDNEEDEDEEENDNNEEEIDEHEADDDVENEDAEYLEYLTKEAINDTADDENQISEDMEESVYQSHLNEIDPYKYFEQTLKSIQLESPDYYAYLMQSLNSEEQNQIVEILSVAEQISTDHP